MKDQRYKDDTIKFIGTKTPAAITKSPILKSDGTMYHVANTIMVLMQFYMNTKQSNENEDQDSRITNATDWEMMQKKYTTKCGVDNHLDQVSTDASEALIGY